MTTTPASEPGAGRRTTRQRAALTKALAAREGFGSAQEIHGELLAAGERVGLATVYRNLQAMAGDGELDVVRGEDGECRYRACGDAHHHHHLLCRVCGRTVEISAPSVERWAATVARDHGFTDVAHTLEVVGRCPDCSS